MIKESYYTIFKTKDREHLAFESEEMPTWDDEFVYIYIIFDNLVLIPFKNVNKIVTRKVNYPSRKCIQECLIYKFHINSN